MKLFRIAALFLIATAFACGCVEQTDPSATGRKYSRVAIYAGLGYNNLSSDIQRNIQQVFDGPIPMKTDSRALLLFVHQSRNDSDYETPTSPYIIRVTSDWNGIAVCDTLLRMDRKARMTDPDVFREGLEFIRDNFESDHYGLLVSSHGTGWLPEGYYDSASSFDFDWSTSRRPMYPYLRVQRQNADEPRVKSFGCEAYVSGGKTYSAEMEIRDFAAAIPMKLDYLIFDACLMGCVEVAYELKNKCDVIGFSQAEVITTGFDMRKFVPRFLMGASADPAGFCEDYYDYYNAQSGSYQSATISLIDCSALDELANVCRKLFSKYESEVGDLDPTVLQRYFRHNRHWFYDLQDILLHAGIDEAEKAELQKALDGCVIYKNATRSILGDFDVKVFSGFSMYLPCNGDYKLDAFYKGLEWNKATGLVK